MLYALRGNRTPGGSIKILSLHISIGNDPGYHYPINALKNIPMFKVPDTSASCTSSSLAFTNLKREIRARQRICIFTVFNTSEAFKSGFYKIIKERHWIMGK